MLGYSSTCLYSSTLGTKYVVNLIRISYKFGDCEVTAYNVDNSLLKVTPGSSLALDCICVCSYTTGSSLTLIFKDNICMLTHSYYSSDGFMFWSDLRQKVIRRALLDGTGATTLVSSGLEQPGE